MTDKALVRQEEARLREQLEHMRPQFEVALQGGLIKPERFIRVVMTAANINPDLLAADRRSLFNSCMQCANDGLVPDGRQAALVVFKTKVVERGKEFWIEKVQYMPMYQGLMKKVRDSGEVAKWSARTVYEKDTFNYELGDNEHITHKPYMGTDDPGPLIAAYSIVTFKDGTVQRDVLPRRYFERIKARSKTGSKDKGPWKTDFDEMAVKTIIRHHSKQLPLSPALMDIIARDDALTMLDEEPGGPVIDMPPAPPRPKQEDFDKETGEVTEPVQGTTGPAAPGEPAVPEPEDQQQDDADAKQPAAKKAAKKAAATKSEKPAGLSTEPEDPNARWKIATDAMSYLATFKSVLRHTKSEDDVNAMLGVNSEAIAKLHQDTQDAIFKAADERKEALSGG